MQKQTAAQLRLEPGRLRRHQTSRIRHCKKFPDGSRIHGKCHLHIGMYSPLQFRKSPDTSHKIDPLIGLKENVIIGKLIPAGTGMKRYNNVYPYETSGEEKFDDKADL